MKKKMNFVFIKKVGISATLILMNTTAAFAAEPKKEKRDILQQFYDKTEDVFIPLMLIFGFISIIGIGIGLVMNRKNPEKREEEMVGILYFGFGMFIITSAMVIIRAYSI